MQLPAWHVSSCVHRFPSEHGAPFGFGGFEHAPVDGLQDPTSWHESRAVQTTGIDPVQLPDWHVSSCVQAFPSLHAAPLATPDHALVLAPGRQTRQALSGSTVPARYATPPMRQPG
jgi:hypothetical protein